MVILINVFCTLFLIMGVMSFWFKYSKKAPLTFIDLMVICILIVSLGVRVWLS